MLPAAPVTTVTFPRNDPIAWCLPSLGLPYEPRRLRRSRPSTASP
jgi:hypothetical protein